VRLTRITFNDPDAEQILLHNIVEFVIPFKDPDKYGMDIFDHEIEPYGQNHNDTEENKGKAYTCPESEYKRETEHDRRPCADTNCHLERVLHIRDICRQPCDDTGSRELINGGKRECLNFPENIPAKVLS